MNPQLKGREWGCQEDLAGVEEWVSHEARPMASKRWEKSHPSLSSEPWAFCIISLLCSFCYLQSVILTKNRGTHSKLTLVNLCLNLTNFHLELAFFKIVNDWLDYSTLNSVIFIKHICLPPSTLDPSWLEKSILKNQNLYFNYPRAFKLSRI